MGATSELFIQMQDELVNTCEQVENGDIEILDAVIEFRKQRSFHEQMLKEIGSFENQYFNEIENSAKEHQNEYRGAKFEFRAGRKNFDYSKIDEVVKAKENAKAVESKYKTAWDLSQKGTSALDEDTGEILQIPIVKYGKSTMVVKLPK
ncbi:hypothetical protein [Polaribacter aestuariivivens]|uniref:hypothetical protein n=1 Tax=Polaribacter aestuariivivens TaxID=2304626 RepID=UPI003F49717E